MIFRLRHTVEKRRAPDGCAKTISYLGWHIKLLQWPNVAQLVLGILVAACGSSPTLASEYDRTTSLQDRLLRIELDRETAAVAVTDLRTGQRWPQSATGINLPKISSLHRDTDGSRLDVEANTSAGPVTMSLALEPSAELLVSVRPSGAGKSNSLALPLPWLCPSQTAEVVWPTDEGMLLPAAGNPFPRLLGNYTYAQSGFSMPWFGIVQGERGLMVLAETPDDMTFRLAAAPGAAGKSLLTAAVVWQASRDDLRYERRLRVCLFDHGGYVAMAKRYRKFLIDAGRFRTLEEKARELPLVRKLLGAIDIYEHTGPKISRGGPEVLDWMIQNHIRRALYYGPPDRKRNEKALAAGYVTARYDIYTDVFTPELLQVFGPAKSPLDCKKHGYPDDVVVRRDGQLQSAFQYPVGTQGGVSAGGQLKTIACAGRCSAAELAWVKKRVPQEAEQEAVAARFLDVETAKPFCECYSPQHPQTRSADRQSRTELFDYLRSIGQVPSSEGGADWPASSLVYQEGSLTLNHLGHLKGIYVGTGPFDLPDEYIAAQFNMAYRIPLHKLVYHDSLLMTWRWNHTPNRWVKGAEYWDDWDLLHILYGGMPIFILDSRSIAAKGPRMLQTYRNVCGVLEKIGGSEMLSHRFVTANRLVQETRFANGWAVVVNFDKHHAYRSEQGTSVAAGSFEVFRQE